MESNQEKDITIASTESVTPEITPTETTAPTNLEALSLPNEALLAIEAPLPFYKKHPTILASVFAVLLILGAGYYAYTMYYAHGGTVAVVNGTRIYADEYSTSIDYLTQIQAMQGADATDEQIQSEIRTQALDGLIDNILIITTAKKEGIVIADVDIQAKYDELVTELGSKEELEKRMAEMNLTDAKLRSNIESRMLADAYITAKTTAKDLAVTEEEVNEFIASINVDGAELPPLDEIRPQIEAQILNQKQQQVVATIVAQLREEGDIDIRI
jgi:hypothetical protein